MPEEEGQNLTPQLPDGDQNLNGGDQNPGDKIDGEGDDYNPFSDPMNNPEQISKPNGEDDSDDNGVELSKLVDQKLQPLKSELENSNLERKVDNYLSSDKGQHFGEYRDKIVNIAKQGIKTQSGQPLSIEGIVALATGTSNLLKIGASMGNQANEEARSSYTGGNSRRSPVNNGGIPDVSNMSSDDFVNLQNQVRSGQFRR